MLDVTDDAALAALGAELDGTTVDILVNCAGDWLISYLPDTNERAADHILRVNLRAPYILSRTLLPNLRRSDNASIINIGSIVTSMSVPTVSAYTAAKVGLKGLTGSLAAELKPDLIRVVMISPGPADTPMRDAASPGSTSPFWCSRRRSPTWCRRWCHCRAASAPAILSCTRCCGNDDHSFKRGSRISRKPSSSRVNRQHSDHDCQSGIGGNPGSHADKFSPFVEHQAPFPGPGGC